MRAHVQRVERGDAASFVYRVKADRRFARAWHYHSECELTWIERSSGQRFVGDSVEEYSDSDLVLLGANLPHTWRSSPRAETGRARLHRATVVQFREDFLGEDFLESPELHHIRDLLARSRYGLRITGRARGRVFELLRRMRRENRLRRLLTLIAILDVIASRPRDTRQISSSASIEGDPGTQRRFDRVLEHVESRIQGTIRQADAAAIAGLSPAGFCRWFRRTTGKTFTSYVGELRVARACELLVETDRSILEISLASGFANLSNFNRRFRRVKGMTPREYRASFSRSLG